MPPFWHALRLAPRQPRFRAGGPRAAGAAPAMNGEGVDWGGRCEEAAAGRARPGRLPARCEEAAAGSLRGAAGQARADKRTKFERFQHKMFKIYSTNAYQNIVTSLLYVVRGRPARAASVAPEAQ